MFRLHISTALRILCASLVVFATGIVSLTAQAQDISCGDRLGTATTPIPRAEPGTWVTLSDMPRPRSEFAAAVIGDWIYVAGGFGGSSHLDCFHPATNTWAIGPDLPAGVHHPGVASLDGVLYVAGGYTDEHLETDALWAYDPQSGAWDARASMPTARGALGLSAFGGKLYAIGGATGHLGGPVTGVVEIYDPEIDAWASGTDMPTPREHLAAAADDNRIYTIGGRANGDESDHLGSAVEAYDPMTDSWEALPPMPTPRSGFSGVVISDQLVVLGGERGTTTLDTVEAYDIAEETWHELPPMPTARHGVAVAAIDNTMYAIAGSTLGGRVENTGRIEAFTLTLE